MQDNMGPFAKHGI